MSDVRQVLLRDLLVASKDGDWGSEGPPGIPTHIIRGADFPAVRRGQLTEVPLRYLPQDSLDRRTLRPNDILIETAGGSKSRPTGRTLLVTSSILSTFSGPVTCASFARYLRVDQALVEPRYLYWHLQYLHSSGAMWKHQVQHTGVARFQFTRFAETERIPLPNLLTQKAVSDFLEVLDDKIAVNDRIARTCRELGQTIFASRIARSKIAIQEICTIVTGQSPPGESYNDTGDGLPFYQGNRDFGFHHPRRRVWSTAVTRHAAAGDVLVSVRAPVGQVNVASEACGIGRGLAALSAHAYPHTLHHALMADTAAWAPFEGEGTVFSSINKQQLHALRIRWPEQGEEIHLEPDLRVLDQRLMAALAENESLGKLRDTLLPELMSGRLRVRDAEKIAEEAV